jgi:hypothetical protein
MNRKSRSKLIKCLSIRTSIKWDKKKYPRSIIFREILNTGIGCVGSFITTSKGLTAQRLIANIKFSPKEIIADLCWGSNYAIGIF